MNTLAVVLFAFVAAASAGLLPDGPVPILNQESEVNPDGSFHNKFETGNGIAYQEDGSLKSIGNEAAVVSQGSASHTAPDGTPIQLTWVADENGFQPQGAHLPVGPAIPPQIARALEWIARNPYVEPKH